MGSRAWVVILVIGILGVGAMGLLTNLAVSSNPELKKIIEFKAALASELKPRGIEEVSVKRAPRRAYEVRLTAGPDAGGEALDLEAARFFATSFPDRMAQKVEVIRSSPGRFGCGSPGVLARREFELSEVRATLAEETRRERFERALLAATGCRLVSQERKGSEVRVEVDPLPGQAADFDRLAREIEPIARQELRALPYTSLEIIVRQVGAAAPAPAQAGSSAPGGSAPVQTPAKKDGVRFDARGRELQRSGRPAPGPSG